MKKFFLTLSTFFILLALPLHADEIGEQQETYENLEIFSNVLTLLQQHYVDPINPHDVITGAINGMLTALDPHSSYMSAEDFKELQQETKGSFSGIGIEITIQDSILTVVSAIEGTPAHKAGLQAGDQIVRIEKESTKNMTLMDALKKLRGKKGSLVNITIHRKSLQELQEISLTRDDIPLQSVKSLELEAGFQLIRISNFQTNTTSDFKNALDSSNRKQPLKGLILDLRDNPGGLLDQAIKVADVFLEKGIIVSTRGRDPEQDAVFSAHKNGDKYEFPIIVLVNDGSASASEIVAGALQDHRRAIILGTVTFGKGSVQTIIPMPEGAGLRLTTARYYTPSGDSIQATGIKPDVVVQFIPPAKEETSENNILAIREKDLPRHFESEKEEQKKKSASTEEAEKRLQNDNQLQTALIILKSLRLARMNQQQSGISQ